MVDFRYNGQTNKWLIVSPKRAQRPGEKAEKKPICPFCYGNEYMTPPEVLRIGEGKANESGWKIRVVPNKYKITDIHEVIIHTPNHQEEISNFTDEQMIDIFKVYRERYVFYQNTGNVVIFNNTGRGGGESLEHSHSQLTVIPFDKAIDTPALPEIDNIIYEDEYITIFCPNTSEWPYEFWIVPKKRNALFGDISDTEITAISKHFKKMLIILRKELDEYSYNYYLYPLRNWYLRFIPRTVVRGGFELSSGIFVNIKDPKEVAEYLKNNL